MFRKLPPLAEAIHHHGDGADLEPVRGQPDKMAGDALELGDQHTDVHHPLGHFDTEQLLDGQTERQAVGLRAQVVHPLHERNHLLPFLLLGGLLDSRVQVSDRRVGVDDDLAGQLQHQPQHAVRAGVLRPHVDGHRLGSKFRRRLHVWHCFPARGSYPLNQ